MACQTAQRATAYAGAAQMQDPVLAYGNQGGSRAQGDDERVRPAGQAAPADPDGGDFRNLYHRYAKDLVRQLVAASTAGGNRLNIGQFVSGTVQQLAQSPGRRR